MAGESESNTDDIAIKIEKVSKRYKIYQNNSNRLKEFLVSKFTDMLCIKTSKTFFKDFWALHDISLEIKKGESWAILGKNGSGKSTLLQIICGILSSSSGDAVVNGRIAGLLELGSGFNPDFTGRENAVLNGMLHGLSSADIEKKLQSIIDFSELAEFIDQPIKTYSSGMVLRLAFSVIAHVEADILIVDEALAVGDIFFAQKCFRFFSEFKLNGGTLLFVSHDIGAVTSLCDHAILLAGGKLLLNDHPKIVCARYIEQIYDEKSHDKSLDLALESATSINEGESIYRQRMSFSEQGIPGNICYISPLNLNSSSFGVGGVKILSAGFYDGEGTRLSQVITDKRVFFKFKVEVLANIEFPAMGFLIKNKTGQVLYCESSAKIFYPNYNGDFKFRRGETVEVEFNFIMPNLNAGEYFISIAVSEGIEQDHYQHLFMHEAISINVAGKRVQYGESAMPSLEVNLHIYDATLIK